MARFVYGMNLSLDGYVVHDRFAPGPVLFRHWIDQVRTTSAAIYGRKIYELMRYWDDDQPGWSADDAEFAAAWRTLRKWVVSRSLSSVGPNATVVSDNIETALRGLKADLAGEVDVSGTILAQSLTDLGLIDEYRLYFHPVVLGQGKPFFAGPRPRLRLTDSEMIDDAVTRLTYVPA